LGHGLLELEALSRLAALQDQMLALAEQQATYARRRLDLGEATSLEVKIAAQEAEVAEVERARLLAAHRRLQERLRSFLGLEPHHGLQFETRESRRQVLGGKDGVDWENVQPRFFDGRIEALKKELQSWNLTLSKFRLLPGLTAAVQTPDPITLTGVRGYFFSVGLTWPVFDGLRRFRDISRQKTILAQAEAQDEVKTRDVRQQWREALDHVKAAAAARQLARSRLELARLQERQAELKYQGGDPLSQTLTAQRRRLEAEGQGILKDLEHDQAVLEVRHLAGDLINGYVSESSWLP
jgi:outer membrane protein TolC